MPWGWKSSGVEVANQTRIEGNGMALYAYTCKLLRLKRYDLNKKDLVERWS